MSDRRMREGNKAVNAVREKIQKKFFTDKISVSMSETDKDIDTRKKEALKVGDKYKDKDGTVWYRTEQGTLMNKTRVGFYGVPMFCPTKSCGKIMGGAESKLNSKAYMRWGHCYGCQLEKERLMRINGGQEAVDEYYESNKKKNIEGYVKDLEDYMISTVLSDDDIKKYISSSEGDMQEWKGMGITEDELESFQNFINKLKEKVGMNLSDEKYVKKDGKIIKTKNDNKDE